ncbi:MAG: DNA-processing protein DprA [Clostridia bacterium]|nr:DNA-processing protein DprA [Clostridia bacterium]
MELNHHLLWLWAKECLNYNNKKLLQTVEFFGSIEEVYKCNDFRICKILSEKEVRLLSKKDLRSAWETYGLCEEQQIGILTLEDSTYPSMLREIDNPPCPLFFKGHLRSCLNAPLLTVVGSRTYNGYGEEKAKELVTALSCCGFTIVTGLADGIDSFACEAALQSDSSVIAVLPFGILSSKGHLTRHFKEIIAKGALVSEIFPQNGSHRFAYHERNRILSGISHGTLVVQAPEKSGALMTANYACEQNRDLFAVMANADSFSAGSNRLIKEGCYPVTDYTDILQIYLPRFSDRLTELHAPAEKIFSLQEELQAEKLKDFKRTQIKELTQAEQAVFALLSTEECTADYLIENAGLPVHEVLQCLTTLEFRGLAVSCPGSKFKVIL